MILGRLVNVYGSVNSLIAVYKTRHSTIVRFFNTHDIRVTDKLKKKLADPNLAHNLCDTYIRIRRFGKFMTLYFEGSFYYEQLRDATGIDLPVEDDVVTSYDTDGIRLAEITVQPGKVHVFTTESGKPVYVARVDNLDPIFYQLKGDNIILVGST